jgi:peroxiredoxin/predicted 2-oxoglutarate/Fe(II)-dependent dioxygenase YbiX
MTDASVRSPCTFVDLAPGDPAPWFYQRTTHNPNFAFDSIAGRYIVLCFFVTAGDPGGRRALAAVRTHRRLFDDESMSFFGISMDPADEEIRGLRDIIPGIRFFWDFDGAVSRMYGAIPREAAPGDTDVPARRFWLVLDPTMRVMKVAHFGPDGAEIAAIFDFLQALPPPERFSGIKLQAPVLYLPNVFEAEFCRHLVDLYEANGGEESGFMRDIGGKTVGLTDYVHKRRKDYRIEDEALIRQAQARIRRRVVPEIAKAHQFHVTRMERNIVACYAAEDGGHFRPHRDNTTRGTAHRRFAVSINLNSDFDGGEISFPEYGPRSFKPPPGTAVVFSCSLLHAVSRVTRGWRYAFLPFLYDDAAARIRSENQTFLDTATGGCKED